MLEARDWGAGHAVRRLGDLFAEQGYGVSPLESAHGVLATKRGHGLGPFFPWTDFVFIVDFDAEGITDVVALESLHARSREYGESRMKVPRLLRYRVPNSVTFGVSASGFSEELIGCARKSRHSVNTGEKNAVYLLDLGSGMLYSQGLQRDTLRWGGTWSPNVNPANRMARLMPVVCGRLMNDDPQPVLGSAPSVVS